MDYKIKKIATDLYHITLYPPIAGFKNFISSWLFTGRKTLLVDPGPSVTIKALVLALADLDVKKLDHILLTHIHVDHAGGTGDLLGHFPDTQVICPDGGMAHLEDPTRLQAGTIKTLGDLGLKYGKIMPVKADLMVNTTSFHSNLITVVNTPGHSAHHVSYVVKDFLFAGEASGVFISLPDGRLYLRPATPPKFFLAVALKSIESLLDYGDGPVCFGHYGMSKTRRSILTSHRNQLLFWKNIMEDEIQRGLDHTFRQRCLEKLLSCDPHLKAFYGLEKDAQQREKTFLLNSIRGFEDWILGQMAPLV